MRIRKRFIIGSLIGAIFLFLVVPLVWLYTAPKQNTMTIAFARTLRLPFARVNGFSVTLSQVLDDVELIKHFEGTDISLTDEQVRSKVWDHIREEYGIRKLASEQSITWTSNEVEDFFKTFLTSNELEISDLQHTIPNFNETYFKEHTILPMLLHQKIAKKMLLAADNDAAREATQLREQVQKDPSQFDAIIQKRADEQHIADAGSTVLLSAATLAPDEVSLLKGIAVGGISPIIAREDGYRIYKVTSHFTQPEEAWQVKELFVPASLYDEALAKITSAHDEKVYIKGVL